MKKIGLFVLLFMFSPAVFSANDFSLVIKSFEDNHQKQNQKKSNQDTNDLGNMRKLAAAYINLANNLTPNDCNKLKTLSDLFNTKKEKVNLDYEEDYYENEDLDDNYKKFGCKLTGLTDNEINYILLPKLFDEGVSLYKTAILNGDIESIPILLTDFATYKIPRHYLYGFSEDNSFSNNPYGSFLVGQLYIDERFFSRDLHKAIELFEKAKDIQGDDLWYFLVFAKMEEMIESPSSDVYNISILQNSNNHHTKHAEIIKQLEKTLTPNDVLHTLHLSLYYADDEKLNKAIEYFERACNIKSSSACNLYQKQLKQPEKNKIYSLFRQFDKTNPDIKITTDIAKWYEDSKKLYKAINYYSYIINKDPELLLKIAALFKKSDLNYDLKTDMLVKIYTKYDSFVDRSDIKYEIYLLYYPSMDYDDPASETNKIGLAWLKKAAITGSAKAKLEMAKLFESGKYFTQNYTKALYWYGDYCKISINSGYGFESFCEPFLGDTKDMINLIAKADGGNKEAQYELGVKFVKPSGLEEIGLYYLRLAADQGHEKAKILYIINPYLPKAPCFSC
ncbi:hypothetical protein A9G42_01460 [Gilliamella sp. Nev6-6]|uniref:SEL1-like repeat protein n=1 Tax=Gilliamella sp. Nev6-6 TaxID=3120252 RepID=UPI00080F5820|nr:SEL1-like repeat protein [Gilliamella apicola]OCG79047.1 hypothetical protein A9G42_01460 [Gilliamella apicola]